MASSWPNRAERRREWSQRAKRIDAPPEVDAKVREQVATTLTGKRLLLPAHESVDAVLRRETPELFAFAESLGFVLSFDLPEMTPQALARGVVAYSLTRIRAA